MIDPKAGRQALREYAATTPIERQIEDVRRWTPELAERLGLNDPAVDRHLRRRKVRRVFDSFGRSVHRLFS
ncbi:MAG: hypothetical protein JO306_02750 [Gemmatimonadetes bacterium]|nr:hypothetical protein [Gemmatimonadota bacterium]